MHITIYFEYIIYISSEQTLLNTKAHKTSWIYREIDVDR